MKSVSYKIRRHSSAFSLAEVLAALIIGAMVLVAVLGIYSRSESVAAAITHRLDESRLPSEVLQRIAEDIDRIVSPGTDAKIAIESRLEKGIYSAARLTILKTIYNKKNKSQAFERIVWQSSYDSDANSLILYRSHSGIASEDKMLDEQKENWEKELFIPICAGVTFFKVQVPKGEGFQDKFAGASLPTAIVVTISFAEPSKSPEGVLEVPDSKKITRTIVIDRTRKIKFTLVRKEDEKEQEQSTEQPK